MADTFARPQAGYIPTLDGWRTIAILGVMLFHGGPLTPSHPLAWSFQKLGASGVELFFAISGILICGRLLDEEEARGGISLRKFYLRRLFRIQPAALFFLVVLALLGAARITAFSAAAWMASLLFVRNLYRSLNPATGAFYTGHFWSLAIEEHFYLVVPWLLVLLRGRNRLRWMGLIALVSLLSNEWMQRTRIAQMPVNSEFELCWLFLAAWLALLVRRPKAREMLTRWLPAGPVLGVICLIGVGVALRWKVVQHLWAPSFPLLVLATVLHPQSWVSRVLEWSPMRMIGRISYSLYLWQQIFCVGVSAAPEAGWPLGWMQHHPQCYVLPFGCAFASYFWIEKPFVTVGHRLSQRASSRIAVVRVGASSAGA